MSAVEFIPTEASKQDALYQEIELNYSAALERLARAYEADRETCRDLLQEIHIALWHSLAGFDRRCSLRTWVYRVAHNVATSHVIRDRRAKLQTFVSLEALDLEANTNDTESAADRRRTLDRLLVLIQRLNPIDRQVILLYLEGLDAASIGAITGISSGNVATKIHRIKNILVRRFHQGRQS